MRRGAFPRVGVAFLRRARARARTRARTEYEQRPRRSPSPVSKDPDGRIRAEAKVGVFTRDQIGWFYRKSAEANAKAGEHWDRGEYAAAVGAFDTSVTLFVGGLVAEHVLPQRNATSSDLIMMATPIEVPAAGGVGGTGARAVAATEAAGAESTTQMLTEAAARAKETTGPGKGAVHGTRTHSAFKKEVDALGRSVFTPRFRTRVVKKFRTERRDQ